MDSQPIYREKIDLDILIQKSQELMDNLESCTLCPHACRVNRKKGEIGHCRAGMELEVASYGPHYGEEAPLVGYRGSGTIFFHHCPMHCIYCQNWTISQGHGEKISIETLAGYMEELQALGCHNINLVTPTHYLPQILAAIVMVVRNGLNIPIVYNCGGYESTATLKKLDGIIDIYLPDAKYSNKETAEKLSGISGYPEAMKAALKEMHRQVGDLKVDQQGIAQRGLFIRHLVLPNHLAGTQEIIAFIAEKISPTAAINIMAQYYPTYHAFQCPSLNRRLSRQEYEE
ncbi:MAG TPA: radical SAM protein, partial [Candidatus Atribacteria bacterium]|nr:radical SAM protein [Candidatus Atribacteria bacterium]